MAPRSHRLSRYDSNSDRVCRVLVGAEPNVMDQTCTAIVDVTGEVRAVRVTQSLTPGLDDAVMTAARKWRFEPARLNGAPTPILVTLILEFRLKRQPSTSLKDR